MEENRKIGSFAIAMIYVGSIIGAGFASGREIWQYFGVFGKMGIIGLLLAGCLFIIFGIMLVYIGRKINSNDMGKVILPFENKTAASALGYVLAVVIFVPLVTMSAAGGAFVSQQFGIHRAIGGLAIVVMVIFTVLGNFERISKVFNWLMPILVFVVAGGSFYIILFHTPNSSMDYTAKPSPLAPKWYLSAFVYMAYNFIGTIPMMSKAGMQGYSTKTVIRGAALGGFILFVMAFSLNLALAKDPMFADSLDLPMLGMVGRVSYAFNFIYSIVLFFAIYSAATSTFYGVTTKIKEGKYKNYIIIVLAIIGFFLGLAGFRRIVAIVFPIIGIIGFLIIFMIIINFFRVYKGHGTKFKE